LRILNLLKIKKFVTEEIDRLKKLENKSQTEEIILTLVSNIESGTPTKQQISSFERIMKNEFKKYKARLELEKIKEDEKTSCRFKKEVQVAQAKDRKNVNTSLLQLALFLKW
jgi:RNase H-fold protein (predicted Holliday junction resolvase)